MDVSFVIPLYNCLPLTQAMLASFHATVPTGLAHEIIFVDDGSTDGTRDWLKSISGPRCTFVLNEQNLGYAGANNRGAERARGKFLFLLNNDLVLTDGWLEPMLDLLGSHPEIGAVGNVQLNRKNGAVDHTGIFINAKGKPAHDPTPPQPWSRVRRATAVTGACLALPRELWSNLGGFDERYVNGCEDIDLCLRIAARRRRIVVALRSVIHHHISASPGRKRRDEENTRRLTLRWRDELIYLGAKSWCDEYVARELTVATAFAAPADALAIAGHALGLTREPPPVALAAMQRAIDRELARWQGLLGNETLP